MTDREPCGSNEPPPPNTLLAGTVLVPIASEADAEATCRAILRQVSPEGIQMRVVHVIEKAGGAPDKAGVEQRELRAERIFDVVETYLGPKDVGLETEILYGTDVADTLLERAREIGATAIVFTPRGASRWVRLVAGDVARNLLNRADRPVVILPQED